MTNYRNRIGEAIAFARNVAGRSQQELADMLGRDKRTIQKWERGEIRIALEDFLDVFDTLHLPVGPYEMWIRHPELFPRGMEDIKGFSTKRSGGHWRIIICIRLHRWRSSRSITSCSATTAATAAASGRSCWPTCRLRSVTANGS